jgi:hypothetical protein
VPKANASDDDRPRRRRGGAVAVEQTAERSLAIRIFLHSPKDMIAGAIAFAAVSAIIANAIFMQAGRHPSPMFGGSGGTPAAASVSANPLPRPRPVEADAKLLESKPPESKPLEIKPVEVKPADPLANQPKASSTSSAGPVMALANTSRHDPVGEMISSSRRVASVQRVLTEYGYGQLKPTGTVGSDTQSAIQKFERDRKIPVTGQVSERLVRELTAMTGRPID